MYLATLDRHYPQVFPLPFIGSLRRRDFDFDPDLVPLCLSLSSLVLVSRLSLILVLALARPSPQSIRHQATYKSVYTPHSPSSSLSASLSHLTPLEYAQSDSSHLRITLVLSVGPSTGGEGIIGSRKSKLTPFRSLPTLPIKSVGQRYGGVQRATA